MNSIGLKSLFVVIYAAIAPVLEAVGKFLFTAPAVQKKSPAQSEIAIQAMYMMLGAETAWRKLPQTTRCAHIEVAEDIAEFAIELAQFAQDNAAQKGDSTLMFEYDVADPLGAWCVNEMAAYGFIDGRASRVEISRLFARIIED